MQNISLEIKKSSKASAFTLIVAFVCVALVGLALVPLLPVKLNPSRTLPGFTGRACPRIPLWCSAPAAAGSPSAPSSPKD